MAFLMPLVNTFPGRLITCRLLRPDKSIDGVVELRVQTLVSKNGELAEPQVVDEAGITQPIY